MKKKTLLLTLLALAILTSITAGTLAVYTKSVTIDTNVQIKKFAFTAAATDACDEQPIKLAPTESQSYIFTVTNIENKTAAEIALHYDIKVDFSEAAKSMPGLTAKLYEDGNEIGTIEAGSFEYKKALTMPAGEGTTREYKLTLTWGGKDDTGHSNAGFTGATFTNGLQVAVVATQVI